MDNNNLLNKDNQNQNSGQGQFQQQPYQPQQSYQPPQQPYQQYQPQQPYQQAYQAGDGELEEPVTFADWMGTMLIMFIPCVNIIMMFVWAFGSTTKKSKANYFKATLVWTLIAFVLAIVMGGVFGAVLGSLMQSGAYY